MADEADRPIIIAQPGVIAGATATAQDAFKALGAQPVLLLIIMLNIAMLGCGAWFLLTQESYRHDERSAIIKLFERCLGGSDADTSRNRPVSP